MERKALVDTVRIASLAAVFRLVGTNLKMAAKEAIVGIKSADLKTTFLFDVFATFRVT